MRRLLAAWLILTAAIFASGQSFSQGPSMLLLGAGKPSTGAAPPVTPTTFDPANKSTNITLSGGNLIATAGAGAGVATNVRTVATCAGKTYAEFTPSISIANTGIGLVNASESIGTNYIGQTTNSIGLYPSGSVFYNNATLTTIASFTLLDVVSMAVDQPNGKGWWRTNAGNWNNSGAANPATNAGGITIGITGALYMAIEEETPTTVVTGNWGATAYAQTPPSGFLNCG